MTTGRLYVETPGVPFRLARGSTGRGTWDVCPRVIGSRGPGTSSKPPIPSQTLVE